MYLEQQLDGDSIEVLVLGTSHALYGIAPEYFSVKGFNLAHVDQSFDYDKELTLKYLPSLKKLKLVILPVSYSTFYFQLENSVEAWRTYFYKHYWDIKDSNTSIWDSRYYSISMTYGNGQTFNFIKGGFKENWGLGIKRDGWQFIDMIGDSSTINDVSARDRVRFFNDNIEHGDFASVTKDVEAFVAMLKAKGIKTVFVTIPTYKTFRKFCNPKIIDGNKAEVNRLCSKYGCSYYNYFNDNRFELKEFSDNDHLNNMGAKKLSEIMDADIIRTTIH